MSPEPLELRGIVEDFCEVLAKVRGVFVEATVGMGG
jgi:hypothetical protein